MFASIWNKYFPVIKILMKKSAYSEQILDFNSIDLSAWEKRVKSVINSIFNLLMGKLIVISTVTSLQQV
jgi:hypothetical protein